MGQPPKLGHRTLRCFPPLDLNSSVLQPGTSAKAAASSELGCDGLIEGQVGLPRGKGNIYVKRTRAPLPCPLAKCRALVGGGRREDSSKQKL